MKMRVKGIFTIASERIFGLYAWANSKGASEVSIEEDQSADIIFDDGFRIKLIDVNQCINDRPFEDISFS